MVHFMLLLSLLYQIFLFITITTATTGGSTADGSPEDLAVPVPILIEQERAMSGGITSVSTHCPPTLEKHREASNEANDDGGGGVIETNVKTSLETPDQGDKTGLGAKDNAQVRLTPSRKGRDGLCENMAARSASAAIRAEEDATIKSVQSPKKTSRLGDPSPARKSAIIKQVFLKGEKVEDDVASEQVALVHSSEQVSYVSSNSNVQVHVNKGLLMVRNQGSYTGFLAKIVHKDHIVQQCVFRPESLTTMPVEDEHLLIFLENDTILALPDNSTRLLRSIITAFAVHLGDADSTSILDVAPSRPSLLQKYGFVMFRMTIPKEVKRVFIKLTGIHVRDTVIAGRSAREKFGISKRISTGEMTKVWRETFGDDCRIKEDFNPFFPENIGYWRMAKRLYYLSELQHVYETMSTPLQDLGLWNPVDGLLNDLKRDIVREYRYTFNIPIQEAHEIVESIHMCGTLYRFIRFITWGKGVGGFLHRHLGSSKFGVIHLIRIEVDFWELTVRSDWYQVVFKLLEDHDDQYHVVESDALNWLLDGREDKWDQICIMAEILKKYQKRASDLTSIMRNVDASISFINGRNWDMKCRMVKIFCALGYCSSRRQEDVTVTTNRIFNTMVERGIATSSRGCRKLS